MSTVSVKFDMDQKTFQQIDVLRQECGCKDLGTLVHEALNLYKKVAEFKRNRRHGTFAFFEEVPILWRM